MNIFILVNWFIMFLIAIILWLIVGIKWNKLSNFLHSRYTYIDLSFILIYFAEQIILSYLIYNNFNPQIIVAGFSIIIITTASLQNKCQESRIKKIQEKINKEEEIIFKSNLENNKLIEDKLRLSNSITSQKNFINLLYKELIDLNKDVKNKKLKKKC